MNPSFPRIAVALLLFTSVVAAQAHVTLEYEVGHADSGYKATFKVGHGCGESPTRQITVEVPPGVLSARPMPKAGWTLEVQRAPLPQPVTHHGRTVTEDVARIAWTAKTREDMLLHAHYEEFVVSARLPARAGTLFWPVRQVCEQGRNDWVEVPKPGQKAAELKSPAPVLEVLPAAGGGHRH